MYLHIGPTRNKSLMKYQTMINFKSDTCTFRCVLLSRVSYIDTKCTLHMLMEKFRRRCQILENNLPNPPKSSEKILGSFLAGRAKIYPPKRGYCHLQKTHKELKKHLHVICIICPLLRHLNNFVEFLTLY